MADYYRDLIQLLKERGYEFKRQGRGDHEIWWNPMTKVHVRPQAEIKIYCERNFERSGASESVLGRS